MCSCAGAEPGALRHGRVWLLFVAGAVCLSHAVTESGTRYAQTGSLIAETPFGGWRYTAQSQIRREIPHGPAVSGSRRSAVVGPDGAASMLASLVVSSGGLPEEEDAAVGGDAAEHLGPPSDPPLLPDGVHQEGLVKVAGDVGESSRIQAEEANRDCMQEADVAFCLKSFGSFGVKRLYCETWRSIDDYGWTRPEWMNHPNVQKARLYDLTLPMTRMSGAYEVDGNGLYSVKPDAAHAITQRLTVFEQLSIGVRALDLPVAMLSGDGEKEDTLYTANGLLTASLREVLLDIRRFLGRYKNEVILVMARKATDLEGIDGGTLLPYTPGKLPGQAVHEFVAAEVGEFLGNYSKLKKLENSDVLENPVVEDLVRVSARLLLFWEGQQVLCNTFEACHEVPGWAPPIENSQLAFGKPMGPGLRKETYSNGIPNEPVIEPACVFRSVGSTASWQADQLIVNLKRYAIDPVRTLAAAPPDCLAPETLAPGALPLSLHSPPVMHEADAFTTLTPAMRAAFLKNLRNDKEIFKQGEGLNVQTAAERANFLLLNGMLRNDTRPLFSRVNVLAVDFITPIIAHRIIEAMQGRRECGYVIHCLSTASCYAATRLSDEDGQDVCLPEEEVYEMLKLHAGGDAMPFRAKVQIAVVLFLVILCCCMCCGTLLTDYVCCPLPVKGKDYIGCAVFRWAAKGTPSATKTGAM